ncbi:MAG: DUF5302 domain-containing protein [Actinomycetota bacterium]|nr:DUF5302 domain-containing protein [Actinomycetota bacterium]
MAPSAEGAGADGDDVRRKFQEALARKQGNAKGGGSAGGHGTSEHGHTATGPAKAQRTFRRKSGG